MIMILIADSGATSTDWRIINKYGSIEQFKSVGFNPNYGDPDAFTKDLTGSIPEKNIEQVFFYGAGCSTEKNKQTVHQVLKEVFPSATITIDHDLTAAARALCLDKPGIACIMGTGSNACAYDGNIIIDKIPNLGMIMGDEGSGAHLGKILIKDFLFNRLPDDLRDKFANRFPSLNRDEVIDHLYYREGASKYLAGFTRFIHHHLKHPYIYYLVYNAFLAFIETNIYYFKSYKDYPLNFTGSIAFYFNSVLRQACADRQLKVGIIMEMPIAGLTLYHQKFQTP